MFDNLTGTILGLVYFLFGCLGILVLYLLGFIILIIYQQIKNKYFNKNLKDKKKLLINNEQLNNLDIL